MKHNQVDFTVDGVPGGHHIDFTDDAVCTEQHLKNASSYIREYIRNDLGVKTNPAYQIMGINSVEDNL